MANSILKKEGPKAFYKGLDAHFIRLASWNSIMFITLEQIKKYCYDPAQEKNSDIAIVTT